MASAPNVYDVPSNISSEEGIVFMEGPGNLAVAFTPEAAVRTGERLISEAADAFGKQLIADNLRKRSSD